MTKSDNIYCVCFSPIGISNMFSIFPQQKKRPDKEMRLSSNQKMLLKYTDAFPDGMVFDQKLQTKVLRKIIGQEDNDRIGKRAMRIVRTKSLSIKKITKADVVNSDETVSYETTHEFFSHIQSEKSLRLVIDTIFDLANAETEKKAFETKDVYKKIWNLYKHTEDERERKEESRVEGNHVRKVVKPMEARLNAKIQNMDKKMEQLKSEMKSEMKEMKEKMDRMLALLEKR